MIRVRVDDGQNSDRSGAQRSLVLIKYICLVLSFSGKRF